ncbi:MAG TPA: SDR family NAD(P)-dependent oxidoreductase [Gemmataceae bacterium]|nr:SDR family NAD(P)-dependent oxidoreductase [Gemmataceae bacterium]
MTLHGKVAVVTGAASGMGRALCQELAREGVRLGLLDRNVEGLASLEEELRKQGAGCRRAVADVSDRQAVRSAIQTLVGELGPVDLLVACAGITAATFVDDLAIEQTEAILRVNLLGVIYSLDAVLPDMLARQSGHIVALASLAGCRGMPFSAAYSASKAGLMTYLESLRPPLRRRGIAVTTVLPGFVRTPLMLGAAVQPPMAMMEPEDASRHILRAIRRRSRVYAFPWSTSLVLNVLRWLPPWLYDWCMARGAAHIPNVTY